MMMIYDCPSSMVCRYSGDNKINNKDHIGSIFRFRLQITPANQSQSHSVWDQHTTRIRKTAPSIISHNLFHLPSSSAHTASHILVYIQSIVYNLLHSIL